MLYTKGMLKSAAIFLAAGILMFAPFSVSAAETGFFGAIVPEVCNCEAGATRGASSAPDWGCALQTLQNVVRFAISMAVVIVTLVAAYAGILLITSPFNAENRSKAKNMLLNAVIGLVITLCSWLIVDFVMKALYNESEAAKTYGAAGVLPWEKILGEGVTKDTMCFVIKEAPQYAGSIGGSGDGLTSCSTLSAAVLAQATPSGSEVTIRDRLRAGDVYVNNADRCPPGITYQEYACSTSKRCTSVGTLREPTIQHTLNLAKQCESIKLTGGSESGHSTNGQNTHEDGFKIDISTDHSFCVRRITTKKSGAPTFGSEQRSDSCANIYTLEGDHWDIMVNSACFN